MDKLINDFSYGLFFWQAIILLILIFLLGKYAWKPIVNGLEAREKGIADALAAADNARRELANLKSDNERLLQEARAERDVMLQEARKVKEQLIAEAKAEAQVQGEKMIEQAKATISSEKAAALAEIKGQVSDLSVAIAEKLIKNQLTDQQAQNQLVERLLDDVKLN